MLMLNGLWELADDAFQVICKKFNRPEIDLFASRLNKKCSKFVSWHNDPEAFRVDAFTLKWSTYFFYAFPPFCLILKVLQKIILDKAEGIVLVPLWPTQPCVEHKFQESLTLVAGVLSGRHF